MQISFLVKIAKVVIAFALLYLILSQVRFYDQYEVDELGNTAVQLGVISSISNIDKGLFFLAILVVGLSYVVMATRWWYILSVLGLNTSLKYIMKTTFMANFYGMVIPGMIGGDVVKGYLVARDSGKKASVFVSIIVDRLHGISGFVFLAIAALFITWSMRLLDEGSIIAPLISIVAIIIPIAVFIPIILSARLRGVLKVPELIDRFSFLRRLTDVFAAIDQYRAHGKVIYWSIGLTFLAQSLGITSVALIGYSMGLPLPWYTYFIYVPLITIISAVPLTPGGVGVMEELYLIYMASIGNENMVVALALLVRVSILAANLPGFIIAVMGTTLSRAKIEKIQREVDALDR